MGIISQLRGGTLVQAGPTDFIEDTFNRPNQSGIGLASDSATAHDGGVWTITDDTLANIIDNQLQLVDTAFTSNFATRLIPGTPTVYEVSADLYRQEFTNGVNFVLGATASAFGGSGDYYQLTIDSNGGDVSINRWSGGVPVTAPDILVDTWGAPSGAAFSRLTFRRDGAILSVIQDGAVKGSWTDPSPLGPTLWAGLQSSRVNERTENFWAGPYVPATTVCDDFNRTDRTLSFDNGWVEVGSATYDKFQIVNNQAQFVGSIASAGESFPVGFFNNAVGLLRERAFPNEDAWDVRVTTSVIGNDGYDADLVLVVAADLGQLCGVVAQIGSDGFCSIYEAQYRAETESGAEMKFRTSFNLPTPTYLGTAEYRLTYNRLTGEIKVFQDDVERISLTALYPHDGIWTGFGGTFRYDDNMRFDEFCEHRTDVAKAEERTPINFAPAQYRSTTPPTPGDSPGFYLDMALAQGYGELDYDSSGDPDVYVANVVPGTLVTVSVRRDEANVYNTYPVTTGGGATSNDYYLTWEIPPAWVVENNGDFGKDITLRVPAAGTAALDIAFTATFYSPFGGQETVHFGTVEEADGWSGGTIIRLIPT